VAAETCPAPTARRTGTARDGIAWRGLSLALVPRSVAWNLLAGNLLATDCRLSAVIDFGCLGVGDPACDVMAARAHLPPKCGTRSRAELSVDDGTWARGRGWALSFGLIALPHYQDTNPLFAGIARNVIDAVLSDQPG
jgi:aminoglycoside phosphotransferase (APT) family kinase protein